MGNYNSQYENYYSTLVNKRKNYKKSNSGFGFSSYSAKSTENFILKRLIRDLIGVFILFVFVISCKLVVTPQTKAAYNYAKGVLGEDYDYNKAISAMKTLNLKDTETKISSLFDNLQSKITGQKTLQNKLKQDFIAPLEGTVTSSFGERTDPLSDRKEIHEGVDIDAKTGTEVLCPYDGKVKQCGEDEDYGKYILLDHGNGIESKYGHLNEILVKNGQSLKKGTVIGKSGSTGKSTAPHLHFEIIYMGENLNPEDYIDFSKR